MSYDIGNPESEAVAILNLLDSIGLTGPKLAVSNGDEDALTDQVVDALGIHPEPWHYDFVKSQVKSAVQLEELDGRMAGGATSVSMQRIDGAMYADRVKRQRTEEPVQKAPEVVVPHRNPWEEREAENGSCHY